MEKMKTQKNLAHGTANRSVVKLVPLRDPRAWAWAHLTMAMSDGKKCSTGGSATTEKWARVAFLRMRGGSARGRVGCEEAQGGKVRLEAC